MMEFLQRKVLVTQRMLKYTYFVSTSGGSSQECPALLFVHGFPDSAHLWSAVVAELSDLPNKIIIPDCLGYAGTDRPLDTELYSYKGQADDLMNILNNENVGSTVIIGHDWGSALAQRAYLHRREIFSGMVLLNTGYMVPSRQAFNLKAVNDLTQKTLGYPQFSYWEFLTAPDAPEIIDNNLERMWQVLHGDVNGWMKKLFCVPNAMRNFLLGKEEVPLKPYARLAEWKDCFMGHYKTNSFAPALQMYKATAFNVQSKSDSSIPEDSLTIEVPLLFVLCSKDDVCVPEMMDPAKERGLVPRLEEVVVECGHWSPMERPSEIALHIRSFLTKNYSSK